MSRVRRVRAILTIGAALGLLLTMTPPVAARGPKEPQLSADLDGKPIDLEDVGSWYCHDFDYPAIHCFSDPARLDAASMAARSSLLEGALANGDLAAALSGGTYVTVFEFAGFQGSSMQMSENYSVLSLIGWNDRISSYKVRNSASGVFFVDWLYSGSQWGFCCNQEVENLNAYDNTFSSVKHN